MTDTPKKTLSITRKPANSGPVNATAGTIQRSGKRIIRRDELPQVQRIPAPKPKPAASAKPKKPRKPPAPKKQVTPPSQLKIRELNDRLNAFRVWFDFQPLAIGIEKEIFRLVNEEHFPGASKRVVQKLLRMHVNHGVYLQNLKHGTDRYQLDGTPDGTIDDYQRQLATDTLTKRLQGKS
ncbi:MAG: ProQ/FINO family protein [Candidatus Thiothrix sulfatifontis]|nr:MAG: ProQ/FINO family protein [Candidatus Thiothrix sulfatifontis]